MAQDGALELLQRRPGLEPEVVHEARAGDPIDVERIRLAPAPVESQHEQRLRSLSQWVLRRQRFELPDELTLATACEVSLDPALERDEAKLVEASGGGPQDVALRDVGERVPRPESKCVPEQLRRRLGPSVLERAGTVRGQTLESVQIERVTLDAEQVAGLPRLDHVAAKRLAELRHVALEDVRGGVGRLVVPHGVDQPPGRHHLAGMEQEHREHGTGTRAQSSRATVDQRLDRPEHSELGGHVATVTPARRT